jgi:hypothetical protein
MWMGPLGKQQNESGAKIEGKQEIVGKMVACFLQLKIKVSVLSTRGLGKYEKS